MNTAVKFLMNTPDFFELVRGAWVALGVAAVYVGWSKGRRGAVGVGAVLGLMWLAQPYLMSHLSATAVTGLGSSLVLSRHLWKSSNRGVDLWMSLLGTLLGGLTVLMLLLR